MRLIHLGVVFWGETFRDFFLDFCLPSLLAPGNIPAIENRAESSFLICTTEAEWRQVKAHRACAALETHIRAVHLPYEMPSPGENRMAAMSRGHEAIARAMHERRGYGALDRKSTRLNSSHSRASRMPSSA